RRQRDQVRLGQPLEPVPRLEREVVARAQRPRLARDHRELIRRQPLVGPVDAKDLADQPELERLEVMHHDHGNVAEPCHVAQSRMKAGRMSYHNGITATIRWIAGQPPGNPGQCAPPMVMTCFSMAPAPASIGYW